MKFKGQVCTCGHSYEEHSVERMGLPCNNRPCKCAGFRHKATKPGHPRFHALLEEMATMHARKGSDYSSPTDILSNLRRCEQIGVPAWIGTLIRLSDKFERLQNLARKAQADEGPAVAEESIDDTLMDLAAYALLIRILREEQK